MHTLREHPSLITIRLPRVESVTDIVQMLEANQQLETIDATLREDWQEDWNGQVLPRLECNLYRKRFHAMSQSDRPVKLLSKALLRGGVRHKPSLLFMLLSQNQDATSALLESR